MREFIEQKLTEIKSMLSIECLSYGDQQPCEGVATDTKTQVYEDVQQMSEDFREILSEVESKAAEQGQDDVRSLCHAVSPNGISRKIATQTLIDCLALIKAVERDWLFVREAAVLMRVGQTKIHTWIRSGQLKAQNVNDGDTVSYRIKRSDLLELDLTPTANPKKSKPRKASEDGSKKRY